MTATPESDREYGMRAAKSETTKAAAKERMEEAAARMQPGVNRALSLRDLDDLFRSGRVPDPLPDGFLPGRLLATSMWSPLDAILARIAMAWMPWQGKVFDRAASMGVNRFDASARVPLRVVFPGYTPERDLCDELQAFPFINRVAPGELDPEVHVYKIDYDFEPNPGFIIRRILDELVEIDDGTYLGKILFRTSSRWHPIGVFSLERPPA
jgi:hypothetical protein